MKLDKGALRRSLLLYGVTDRQWLGGRTLAQCVGDAILGGATFVQFREKKLTGAAFAEEARAVQKMCADKKIPFVINDDVLAAKELDADGVHVGQSDASCAEARKILGPDKIIGVSASTAEQALLAERQGADYLGVGSIFATGSKADAERVSIQTLKEICSAATIPVVAIGGIGIQNALLLKNSGIAGISVISAIFANDDIAAATERLCLAARIMKDFRAAIFDLDGTVLDSVGAWKGLPAKCLAQSGVVLDEAASDALDKTAFDMSMEECAEYLARTYGLKKSAGQIVSEANEILFDEYANRVQAFLGMPELLRALKDGGIRLCAATSGSRALEEAALRRLGLLDFFEKIFCCSDLQTTKRSPDIYRAAARFMGAAESETIVVEDSDEALRTAARAGFGTFLARRGGREFL